MQSNRGSLRDIAYETLDGQVSLRGQKLSFERLTLSAFDGSIAGAEFWYPKVLNKHAIGTRDFDMDNLDAVKERMVEVTAAIRAEQFEPKPGPQCATCQVELVCPARAAGGEAFP